MAIHIQSIFKRGILLVMRIAFLVFISGAPCSSKAVYSTIKSEIVLAELYKYRQRSTSSFYSHTLDFLNMPNIFTCTCHLCGRLDVAIGVAVYYVRRVMCSLLAEVRSLLTSLLFPLVGVVTEYIYGIVRPRLIKRKLLKYTWSISRSADLAATPGYG